MILTGEIGAWVSETIIHIGEGLGLVGLIFNAGRSYNKIEYLTTRVRKLELDKELQRQTDIQDGKDLVKLSTKVEGIDEKVDEIKNDILQLRQLIVERRVPKI